MKSVNDTGKRDEVKNWLTAILTGFFGLILVVGKFVVKAMVFNNQTVTELDRLAGKTDRLSYELWFRSEHYVTFVLDAAIALCAIAFVVSISLIVYRKKINKGVEK